MGLMELERYAETRNSCKVAAHTCECLSVHQRRRQVDGIRLRIKIRYEYAEM
jgi:hypothetical protein